MTIGDVNSTAAGSGARYNDGKPDVSLIPTEILAQMLTYYRTSDGPLGTPALRIPMAMSCIADWQEHGHIDYLYRALAELDDPILLATQVFTYGTKKYAAWNWAKGMPWSVPLACAGRHALAVLKGELLDPPERMGSGLPHEGHIACNIIMLIFFAKHFPQGNDITYSVILPQPEAQAA